MPFQSDYLGLWLNQFDVAATMQLPCPREKQLQTAAARMISVECTSTGDAAASDGARAHRVQGNLGFSLGWWRRRILVSCALADFVPPCGSDISRIFSEKSQVELDSKSPMGPNLGCLVDMVPAREHFHCVCGLVCFTNEFEH